MSSVVWSLPRELPVLHGRGLCLRPMTDADAQDLFIIYGDGEVMRHASDPPFPDLATVSTMLASVAQLLAEGASLEWGIIDAHSQRLIGTCGLHSFDTGRRAAEVGCMLNRLFWGRGLARAALAVLFAYARHTLHLKILRAAIDVPNLRSIALFAALGFRRCGDDVYELVLNEPAAG